ncbi:MAG TPA: hypothetical protein VNN15_08985 [Solirubrobacterales bacterium]|nr:hypothetical protein [Solirubrobacterales bacterium]
MQKTLITACLAIAAFAAMVIVPAASASPALTNAKGELVPVGTEIHAVVVGNGVFTGGFNITCTGGEGSGKVTTNTGSSIKGELAAGSLKLTGTGANGDCTSALGNVGLSLTSKICGETVKGTDTVIATGCGGSPLTATVTVTGVGTCKYEAASMKGTFLTNHDAEGTISEQPAKGEAGNGFFCPTEGKLDVSLAESINTGETLFIS